VAGAAVMPCASTERPMATYVVIRIVSAAGQCPSSATMTRKRTPLHAARHPSWRLRSSGRVSSVPRFPWEAVRKVGTPDIGCERVTTASGPGRRPGRTLALRPHICQVNRQSSHPSAGTVVYRPQWRAFMQRPRRPLRKRRRRPIGRRSASARCTRRTIRRVPPIRFSWPARLLQSQESREVAE
jgi:hypothetical protein